MNAVNAEVFDKHSYDAESRLIQIDSSAIQYAYDASGRRIKKVAGGVGTYHFYGLTGLVSEFSTSTSLSSVTAAASTDRVQYRIAEQTGTPVMLLAADGTPRENNRVLPFGERWQIPPASGDEQKFTTYQRDGESTQDYAMARYYAYANGRFMTPDPGHVGASFGDSQSWNAYAYSRNDPVNFSDSTGLLYQLCTTSSSCMNGYSDDDFYQNFAMDPSIFLTGGIQPLAMGLIWINGKYEGDCFHYSCDNPGTVTCGASNDASAWDVGWDWLTGSGPDDQRFTDGDPFTELLRQHGHIQDVVQKVCSGQAIPYATAPYKLGGLDGAPKYIRDYSTLATGGLTGNLAATYLGSYNLRYQKVNDTVYIHVTNSSRISSATHPPIIGYGKTWDRLIAHPLNRQFASGPMSEKTQYFDFHQRC